MGRNIYTINWIKSRKNRVEITEENTVMLNFLSDPAIVTDSSPVVDS